MPRPTSPEDEARAVALAVARTLAAAGHRALFCGGAVRDRLLGRRPGDYDVATSAPPEEVKRLFPRGVMVGARFGVVVVPHERHDVEVATFRDDGLYVDGRRPATVRYSDPERDARRRDFTVNGLFEEPETGEVLDYVGGRADLAARLVRAIGDPEARFREDHLRMLRAVRFAAELGFAIEPGTREAIRRLAPLVGTVSHERVRDEILKMLDPGRGRALRLLRDAGLLSIVLPEIDAMRGVPQPPQFHPEGDVFVHTCLVLDGTDVSGFSDPDERGDLLLAALLHDVAKPPTLTRDPDGRIRFSGHDALGAEMATAVLERLRMPRKRVERVAELVKTHMRLASLPDMRPAKRRRLLAVPEIDLHLRLHAADCGASHGDTSLVAWVEEERRRYAAEPILPPPVLTGRHLIEMGHRPGPRIGRILSWVRDLQLEGEVTTLEDAVRRVRAEFPVDSPEA